MKPINSFSIARRDEACAHNTGCNESLVGEDRKTGGLCDSFMFPETQRKDVGCGALFRVP